MIWVALAIVVLIAIASAVVLMRRGARGVGGARVLARALHLATVSPFASQTTGAHAWIYRRSGGRLLGRWFGSPVLVIETVGRRSGRRRETAIAYVPYDDRWAVMPINGGSKSTPGWWLNLRDGARGAVVVDGQRHDVVPRVAAGEERERLWQRYVDQAPAMVTYQEMAERDVPVVVLERVSSAGSAQEGDRDG